MSAPAATPPPKRSATDKAQHQQAPRRRSTGWHTRPLTDTLLDAMQLRVQQAPLGASACLGCWALLDLGATSGLDMDWADASASAGADSSSVDSLLVPPSMRHQGSDTGCTAPSSAGAGGHLGQF
jgi:hypothetical protein